MPLESEKVRDALLRLNKFDVVAEIKEGMNAFAYRANHTHLNRPVFLKVIYLGKEEHDSILREPRLLVQALGVNPPSENIVRLHDADILEIEGEDYLCLQMEYVDGSSLLSILESRPVGQQEAVRVCTGVLNGLNHLHGQRMLHRDLKPANVLLLGTVPKITDFGSMNLLGEENDFATASRHSALYVPPEGWEEPSRYTFSSDVYQVGMILYELVNGCLIYDPTHYITPTLQRHLNNTNTIYEQLDDVDKTSWTNRGIAELSRKGRLFGYGCPPRIHYSSKIRRIVNCATHPVLDKRCLNVNQFLARLMQINVPDWKPVDGHYEAESWQGFDWRVLNVQTRKRNMIRVEKARIGTRRYRTLTTPSFETEREAFDFVEGFRR
jgi:serine/threonine protein kinase